MWPLTILAEVLGTTDIPGSIDLISRLLETLNKVIRSEGMGQSDTSYVCQMLMSAVERSASQITVRDLFPLSHQAFLHVLGTSFPPDPLGSSRGTYQRLLCVFN